MEREHPIPQQISSYQFRLVGDMTLKQFFQVAGGTLISLIIYSSGVPGYIKWPLIIASFLLGIAFAFFPFQDRPLSTWLILFFKAIYSPTIFVWEKGGEKRQFFQPEPEEPVGGVQPSPVVQTTIPAATRGPTMEAKEELNLEQKEKQFLDTVVIHFSRTGEPQNQSQPQATEEPKVVVPQQQPTPIEPQKQKTPTTPPEYTLEDLKTIAMSSPLAKKRLFEGEKAQFSPAAAPPSPPSKPNVVIGQILDEEQNIIEGVLLEIRDAEGRAVRALKSNKLGHFMIVTPLVDGKYQIIAEKEGFSFKPVEFEAKGEIIPPIAIVGERTGNQSQTTNT